MTQGQSWVASYCGQCGTGLPSGSNFCSSCGGAVEASAVAETLPPTPVLQEHRAAAALSHAEQQTLRRIADYERISAILWLVLGIIQILMLITIVAGIWNIFAASTRFRMSPLILARNEEVPAAYEGIGQLAVIGVLNLVLGGFIGVVFVIFDFVIRDMVLSNRHLFKVASHNV